MGTRKQPEVLEVLSDFVDIHMPVIAGLSENTIRLYKSCFRLLLTYLHNVKGITPETAKFRLLDYETLTGFLDWLETEQKCSVSTRNVRLATLHSFAAYAQHRNLDAAMTFLTSLKRIPAKKAPSKPRTYFTREEVMALLRTPDIHSRMGRRDTVLLSLMYASGMRAQEVCDLTVGNVLDDDGKTILVITGKGKKTRRIRIADRCAVMLKDYLSWRGIARQAGRHVFSTQTHEHMTISCVEAIYKKHLQEAKRQNPSLFPVCGYSPHSMRHTCAMHMLEAGVPVMAIKNFLGHSSVTTTERYAELTQSTVDKHIQEWNKRWFGNYVNSANIQQPERAQKDFIPNFLK